MPELDTPPFGSKVRDKHGNGTFIATVADVFQGSGGYPAMILDWIQQDGQKRGQVFTCRDWRKRWEVK